MRLNDNLYLRERDELLAHLVDDGSISAEAAQRERCERCDGSARMMRGSMCSAAQGRGGEPVAVVTSERVRYGQ